MLRGATQVFGIAVLSVALVGQLGASTIVNDFDSFPGTESWRTDFGGAISGISANPVENSPGSAGGSLQLAMTFDTALGGDNRGAYTGDVFASETDLTGFSAITFDLKILPGAALDAFGNHGFLEFVSRNTNNYNFHSIFGENLTPSTEWRTFTVPLSSVPSNQIDAVRAFTLQLYGGPAQNIDGNITLLLDNIQLIPEPSSALLLALLSPAGLLVRRRS